MAKEVNRTGTVEVTEPAPALENSVVVVDQWMRESSMPEREKEVEAARVLQFAQGVEMVGVEPGGLNLGLMHQSIVGIGMDAWASIEAQYQDPADRGWALGQTVSFVGVFLPENSPVRQNASYAIASWMNESGLERGNYAHLDWVERQLATAA